MKIKHCKRCKDGRIVKNKQGMEFCGMCGYEECRRGLR